MQAKDINCKRVRNSICYAVNLFAWFCFILLDTILLFNYILQAMKRKKSDEKMIAAWKAVTSPMEFNSDRLTKIREKKHMTMTELARRLGLPISCISRWESGKAKPRWKNLEALAEALEIDQKEFVS